MKTKHIKTASVFLSALLVSASGILPSVPVHATAVREVTPERSKNTAGFLSVLNRGMLQQLKPEEISDLARQYMEGIAEEFDKLSEEDQKLVLDEVARLRAMDPDFPILEIAPDGTATVVDAPVPASENSTKEASAPEASASQNESAQSLESSSEDKNSSQSESSKSEDSAPSFEDSASESNSKTEESSDSSMSNADFSEESDLSDSSETSDTEGDFDDSSESSSSSSSSENGFDDVDFSSSDSDFDSEDESSDSSSSDSASSSESDKDSSEDKSDDKDDSSESSDVSSDNRPTLPEKPDAPSEKPDNSEDSSSSSSKPDKPGKPDDSSSSSEQKPTLPSKPTLPTKPEDPSKPDKPSNGSSEIPSIEGSDTLDSIQDVHPASPQPDEIDNRDPNEMPKDDTAQLSPSPVTNTTTVRVRMVSKQVNRRLSVKNLGEINLLPNYNNSAAWKQANSPYNTPYLWGQCTWFAWGRFYELYGFSPRFSGNGYECVGQLLAAHPDKFSKSDKPAAGAVFSSDTAHNHVGIVLDYDESSDTLLIQEGNLDGVSNDWDTAIEDYRTIKLSSKDIRTLYGNVTYAVPKSGVTFVGYKALPSKPETTGQKMSVKFKSLADLSADEVESKLMRPDRLMGWFN